MKVAMLFQDNGIRMRDLSHPENGNPGIGGTEYCFLLLAYYLEKNYGDNISLTMFHFQENVLPAKEQKVDSLKQALEICREEKTDVVLLKNLQTPETYQLMQTYEMNYVIWCHNFLTMEEMQLFTGADCFKRLVCVGRQMYDYYIDDPVIQKMDYVFNMFVPPIKERKPDYDCNVTYVGSLIYQKNFHVLAKAWKQIAREVPEAVLHVLGTGRLYNENEKLGPLGIAEESYETMFFPDISNDGKLMDNVIFHGIMGEEKYDLYCNTAVGVVNPMAATETFCLCAIELESCGVPIVSRKKNGVLDTVKDGRTGILYQDASQLADSVVTLLKDKKKNDEFGKNAYEFAQDAFLPEKIMPEWVRVFQEVAEGKKAVYRAPEGDWENNGKRIRRFLHGIHRVPFLRWVPSIHKLQKK